MSRGKIPPKRPLGFGSSVPRFPKQKKDKKPGPGDYNPKKLGVGPSFSFSRASRFPNAERVDQHLRKNAGVGKVDSKVVAVRRRQVITHLTKFFSDIKEFGYAGAVTISYGDKILFETTNSPKEMTGPPLKKDTKINIASVGKLLTSTAIFQLAEASEMGIDRFLDWSLAEIFPTKADWQKIHVLVPPFKDPKAIGNALTSEEIQSLQEAAPHLTLRSLLTHTSGLAGGLEDSPVFNLKQKGKYVYSNIGFQLLGEVVKKISGKSFRSYVGDQIFKPSGVMHDGHAESFQGCDSQPFGIQKINDQALHNLKPPDGAGGFNLTATELLQVGRSILEGKCFKYKQKTLDILLGNRAETRPNNFYAGGLNIAQMGNDLLLQHGGGDRYIGTKFFSFKQAGGIPYYGSMLQVCGVLGHNVCDHVRDIITTGQPSTLPKQLKSKQQASMKVMEALKKSNITDLHKDLQSLGLDPKELGWDLYLGMLKQSPDKQKVAFATYLHQVFPKATGSNSTTKFCGFRYEIAMYVKDLKGGKAIALKCLHDVENDPKRPKLKVEKTIKELESS